MKNRVPILAGLLFALSLPAAEVELRPVVIRLTRLAYGEQKEIAAPVVVTRDTHEARIRVAAPGGTPLDVAITPRLAGDQVSLAIRSFETDRNGKESATALPVVVTKLDASTEIRVGFVGYRITASLDVPKPRSNR
jgi:hypothetical protein